MNTRDFQTAKLALENYCAYQERCTTEVLKKLESFDLNDEQKNQIIEHLQINNFLSDIRYCSAVVSGKFRINRWGKEKIKSYLRQKRLSNSLIIKAIEEINQDEYISTIEYFINRKWDEIKEKDNFKKQAKCIRFLLSKGFEFDLVKEAISKKL